MKVEKAKNHYIGRDGHKKMNCAQAVMAAFHDDFGLEEELIEKMAACGGGRAEGGMCGAYYAARLMLEKDHKDKLDEFEKHFAETAKSTKCTEIKSSKTLSCVGCVEKAAEYLHSLKK